MDHCSIFVYILKIDIIHMKSWINIPDEIDRKLKKNRELLSRQIFKTQIGLIFQQIFIMILASSALFLLFTLFPILIFSLIGVVIFFLIIIIRYIIETILTRREYSLNEKQNLNYLSEEFMMMVKIYTSKFRIFKWYKIRKLMSRDNELSMDDKMGLIFKNEKQSSISILLLFTFLLISRIISSDFRFDIINISVTFTFISEVLYSIITYFVLKNTNKFIKGYHELNIWGDLLDKYEIIPKQRYMTLLDKDFNNLGITSGEYCTRCGELLELNAQFCIYCGKRRESY